MGSSSFQLSTDSLNGLNKRICLPKGSGSSSSSKAAKQPPRCQVEGCSVDLSEAKAYYGKHKVCGMHSKSPMVIVAGLDQRFCQQCSRFHQLAEFDQGKRSCRRRLAGHNQRRRKPPPSVSLSPHIYGLPSSQFPAGNNKAEENNNRLRTFLMNFTYPCFSEGNAWTAIQTNDRVTDAFSLLSTQSQIIAAAAAAAIPATSVTSARVSSNNGFTSPGFEAIDPMWLPSELKKRINDVGNRPP